MHVATWQRKQSEVPQRRSLCSYIAFYIVEADMVQSVDISSPALAMPATDNFAPPMPNAPEGVTPRRRRACPPPSFWPSGTTLVRPVWDPVISGAHDHQHHPHDPRHRHK